MYRTRSMLCFYEKLPFSLKSDFFYEVEVVGYLTAKNDQRGRKKSRNPKRPTKKEHWIFQLDIWPFKTYSSQSLKARLNCGSGELVRHSSIRIVYFHACII